MCKTSQETTNAQLSRWKFLVRKFPVRKTYLSSLRSCVSISTYKRDQRILQNRILSGIINILSHHQHGYPWLFLATLLYHPLLPVGLQGYIPYLHRATVCRFELVVLPLLVLVKGSTGVRHLWVHLYFSGSVLHVWFFLTWIVFMMGGRWLYSCCFVGCCLQNLFNIVHRFLVQLPSSFFSIRFVSVHVVHL